MSETNARKSLWTVPNILTISRIVLSIVMFAILPFKLYLTSTVIFIVAAATDYVDGWWARKFNQKSQFGRIMDPFADKALVCGTFIYLAAVPEMHNLFSCADSSCSCPMSKIPIGLATWMVVAILLRELFVTMLRSMIESQGGDFSAKWVGKWKTGLQCVDLPAGLLILAIMDHGYPVPCWIKAFFVVLLYVVVYLTLYSGWVYIRAAIEINKKNSQN